MDGLTEDRRRTFTVHQCLGRGGFGEVYRADMSHPSGAATPVALKVLRRDVPPESQAVQRLRDEAMLLSQLHHPTLLRVHDLVVLNGRVCLVTEYVEGQDLSAVLRPPGALPLRALLQVLAEVAAGLHAAYNASVAERDGALRIVHRDVKPSNIRIGHTGTVKLLDFGIARTDEMTREARTATDMMIGSPRYMAPERFTSPEPCHASDVYSLGVILWEGIAGARLFEDSFAMLASLAVDPARFSAFMGSRMEQITAVAPGRLLPVLARFLSYEPEARPPPEEAAELCERLAGSLQEQPTLRSWARAREWPPARAYDGELHGLVLSEGGTLQTARPAAPAGLEPPAPAARNRVHTPRHRANSGWVRGVAAALLGVGAVLGAGSLVSTGLWRSPAPPTSPASAPRPAIVVPHDASAPTAAATTPAPTPTPNREPASTREPGIARADPEPEVLEATAPQPGPFATAPLVVDPPADSHQDGARAGVRVEGGVTIALVDGGARHALRSDPALVQSTPAGSYQLFADFGVGMQPTGRTVSLPPGAITLISCHLRMQTCGVSQP